ncbi:nicotinate-nucleotide adenylyltransferase [Pontiellaceae bacterium B12227]|nr:nicotinate-nucleotide adenylyltransferase [Pontiellaceae bacterium B12227]
MELQPSTKRIGLFGGTFDPVHMGHLVVAQDAAEKLDLDEVIFIPAAIPPHKQHLQQSSAQHRLNMLNSAVESDLRFSVSDIEVSRGGVSYTFDTLCDFREDYSDSDLVLIVGSDTLVDLHNWYNVDELLELCEVASFMRPGESDFLQIQQKVKLPEHHKKRVLDNAFESHMVGISSSEVRMRVAEGLGIRYLVPSQVEMYIFEHGLYRG